MSALWLAIDASSPDASAALAESGSLLAASSGPARGGPPLIVHVDEVFRAAGRRPPDLAGLVAVSGPGSFTGVRVTLATALGLAPAGGSVELLTISSLAALALQAPAGEIDLIAVLDALRGDWFHQRFAKRDGRLLAASEPDRRAAGEIELFPSTAAIAFPGTGIEERFGAAAVHAAPLAPSVAIAATRPGAASLYRRTVAPIYLRGAAVTVAARIAP